MKLKNVKVGETYIIKSLDHTIVGSPPFKIGDKVVVHGFRPTSNNTVHLPDGWSIHHKDLKRVDVEQPPIVYTHQMQEHLGKEVEVIVADGLLKVGMRGFVVSLSNQSNSLLIDFGGGFDGHDGLGRSTCQQKTETCWFLGVEKLKFLTEDEE